MKFWHFAIGALAIGATIGFVWPVAADPLPLDRPVNVNGIDVVCTGIGEGAQHNPDWKTYPIRVEFSNEGAQYLAGAHIALSKDNKQLASFDCSGAWVLLKLTKGTYAVAATLLDHPGDERSATFSPPASGQKRVVLQFPVAAPK